MTSVHLRGSSSNCGPSFIPREMWSHMLYPTEVLDLMRMPGGGVHVVDLETGQRVLYASIPQSELKP